MNHINQLLQYRTSLWITYRDVQATCSTRSIETKNGVNLLQVSAYVKLIWLSGYVSETALCQCHGYRCCHQTKVSCPRTPEHIV